LGAFAGENNFNIIKMQGTAIKIIILFQCDFIKRKAFVEVPALVSSRISIFQALVKSAFQSVMAVDNLQHPDPSHSRIYWIYNLKTVLDLSWSQMFASDGTPESYYGCWVFIRCVWFCSRVIYRSIHVFVRRASQPSSYATCHVDFWLRDKCCSLCSNITFGERQDSGIVLKSGNVVSS
jgi:hypothetical protein